MHLGVAFVQLEAVVMDIERHLNNRPLTYVESDGGDQEVLTPNSIVGTAVPHLARYRSGRRGTYEV